MHRQQAAEPAREVSVSRLRIIVTGLIAQYPLGGVTWDYLQYVVGLLRLGHDVYYLEDTGQWPFNPKEGGVARGCEYNVEHLAGVMRRFGLAERWAYRFPWESRWYGLSDGNRRALLETADLLVNVSGTLADPAQYRCVPRMAFIDSDPVFTQIKLARGQADFRRAVDAHDVHFSFGERLSHLVPDTGHHWRPTRQPVVLSEWRAATAPRDAFTTVMNWTSYKPIEFQGRRYGQKDQELERFLDLPAQVPGTTLELAVNSGKTRRTPRSLLARKGWRVVHPDDVCPDLDRYRGYIQESMAEWSVAKHGYVAGRCGWFSCRSACYLAAGRPVVVQDTGFRDLFPTGEGLLAFDDQEEAVAAIHDVSAHYARHAEASRAIAREYFDSDRVLTRLLEQALGGA